MAKRKAKQHQAPSLGDITLSKPDFEQALSFAEVASSPDKPAEVVSPVVRVEKAAVLEAQREIPPAFTPPVTPPFTPPVNSIPTPSLPRPAEMSFNFPDKVNVKARPSAATLMPKDRETCQVLAERALAIAKPASQQQYEQRSQYLRFRLGAVELYGIPYLYLEGLRYVGNLARVPCTPAFVAGVVNHRGELLTILDLKQFFRMPALAQSNESRIIVVKHAGMRMGLLVDDVDGNEAYQGAELAPPLGSDGVTNMEYVLGIHEGRVTLLNLAALLNDPALRVMS
ncbi:MAG: chemotaxis protein CheW [Gallionella sp.]